MIVKGQRFDLLNRRQIIDLEIEKPEIVPQGALQIMMIPLNLEEQVINHWTPGDAIPGISLTKRSPNCVRVAIDTESISPSIHAITTVIHAEKADVMRFNMKKIGNIFVRINNELFDLKDYADGRAIIAFSIYRRNSLWRFRAIAETCEWGLENVYQQYNIPLELAPHRHEHNT